MILSDKDIRFHIENGDITITPFSESNIKSNSYDVHLGDHLRVYSTVLENRSRVLRDNQYGLQPLPGAYLDAKYDNETWLFKIPAEGYILYPNILYLGVTQERTKVQRLVPFLEGKSSIGRLGIDIHATAGKGDAGFDHWWTLELSVIHPVKVYAGMPIGQIIFFRVGKVETPYGQDKSVANYNQVGTEEEGLPQSSRLYKSYLKDADEWM